MSPSVRCFVIFGVVSSIDSLLVINERADGINIYLSVKSFNLRDKVGMYASNIIKLTNQHKITILN